MFYDFLKIIYFQFLKIIFRKSQIPNRSFKSFINNFKNIKKDIDLGFGDYKNIIKNLFFTISDSNF